MKKILVSAALAAILGTAAFSASAVDGTITFNGKVNSNTCTINAGTGASFAVTLPTVGAGSLGTTAGTVAGTTPFNIALSACSATGTVKAYFEPGATINTNGRLSNTATTGAAAGVDLQVLNSGQTAINLNTQSGTTTATIASNAATLNYFVQYYNTTAAAVTAGNVTSTVNYTIQYQ